MLRESLRSSYKTQKEIKNMKVNTKLKKIAEQLHDGDVIDGILNDDQIALLGKLTWEEIKQQVQDTDDAQKIFCSVAQHLAGEQPDGELPTLQALLGHSTSYTNEDWVTAEEWAADWNEWVKRQQEEALA